MNKILNISVLVGVIGVVVSCVSNNTHMQKQKPIQSILALGDSYTIGESVAVSVRWPVQLKEALIGESRNDVDLRLIAKTGWRTDDLRKAVIEADITMKYDLVTLLIGVNNQYQNKPIEEYPEEFRLCLDQAISFASSAQDVLVVSIPDYAFTPFGQKKNPKIISSEIDRYNEINKRISNQYGVKYVNITDITRNGLSDPKLVADDGLHPSGQCYSEFIPRILKAI